MLFLTFFSFVWIFLHDIDHRHEFPKQCGHESILVSYKNQWRNGLRITQEATHPDAPISPIVHHCHHHRHLYLCWLQEETGSCCLFVFLASWSTCFLCVVVLIKKYACSTETKKCAPYNVLANGLTVVIPLQLRSHQFLLTMKNMVKINWAQNLDTNLVLTSVS